MKIWIDAQLSPALADWINRHYDGINAEAVRTVGLRDAEDQEIFLDAREAASHKQMGMVVMSKDSDFLDLLDQHGPPPKIIWVTCGNASNRRMKKILDQRLRPAVEMLVRPAVEMLVRPAVEMLVRPAVEMLESGEEIVEISDLQESAV